MTAAAEQDGTMRIKTAASLIVKGGTLLSEPCEKCGGVQVGFAGKATCINCGNTGAATTGKVAEQKKPKGPVSTTNLSSAASMIEEKIVLLAAEIRAESDISVQKQKAELVESYLRILEKTKSLINL